MVKYAPRLMAGNYLLTSPHVCNDGIIRAITLETYWVNGNSINTDGYGEIRYMFIVNGRTNHRLYKSAAAARKAAYSVKFD